MAFFVQNTALRQVTRSQSDLTHQLRIKIFNEEDYYQYDNINVKNSNDNASYAILNESLYFIE